MALSALLNNYIARTKNTGADAPVFFAVLRRRRSPWYNTINDSGRILAAISRMAELRDSQLETIRVTADEGNLGAGTVLRLYGVKK